MKLNMQPRMYTKMRIKITVASDETRVKFPNHADSLFRERLAVYAIKVTEECAKVSGGKTLRGTVGLDEATGKMHVTMFANSHNLEKMATVKEA